MERSMAALALAAFVASSGYAELGPKPYIPSAPPKAGVWKSPGIGPRASLGGLSARKAPVERIPSLARDIAGVRRAKKEYLHASSVERRVAERLRSGYPGLTRKKRAAARVADVRKLAQSLEVMAQKTDEMRSAFGAMRRTLLIAARMMKPARRKGTVVPSLDERRAIRTAIYERAARLEIFRRKLGIHSGVLRAQAARVRSHRRAGIDPRYPAHSSSPLGALNLHDGRGKR